MQLKKKAVGIFFLLLLVFAPFFGMTFERKIVAFSPLQSGYNTLATVSTTITFALTNNPAINDWLVIEVSSQDGGTINSVTDTLGNTFTVQQTDTNTILAAIYTGQQTHTTGADTITATFAGTQHNVTLAIEEMAQMTSGTFTVRGAGHGTVANPMGLTATITPNQNDGCFSTGLVRPSGTTVPLIVPATTDPNGGGGFGLLVQNRLTSTMALAFVSFSDWPTSGSTQAKLQVNLANSGNPATLVLWEMVTACFPQSQVTTTTTTTSIQGIAAGTFSVYMLGALVFAFPLVFIIRRKRR